MRSALRFCSLLTALSLTGSLAEAKPLTYREALQAAVESNPTLAKSRLSREQAEAGLLSSWGIFDPNFSAGATWRRSSSQGFFQGFPFESESSGWDLNSSVSGQAPSGTGYTFSGSLDRNFSNFITNFGGFRNEQVQDTYTSNFNMSLSQQLLKGSWLRYNMQNITQSKRNLDTADLQLEQTRQKTLADTASAYWNWVYQDQLAQIAKSSHEAAAEALRIGNLKVEAGELAPVEQTRLEAAEVQARANLMDAENAAQQARDNLLLLMGIGPGAELEPATEVGEVPVMELEMTSAIDVAMAQNLDVLVMQSNLENQRLALASARHGRLPSLEARATAGIGAQSQNNTESGEAATAGAALGGVFGDEAFPNVSIGGTFSVPLGNRAAKGEARRAKASVEISELDLNELQRNISSQVQQQVRQLQSAKARVELADVNLRLAEESLAAEEALAEAGRSIQKNVLDARNEVTRTQNEAAKARNDYRLAQVELLRLQGQLSEDLP